MRYKRATKSLACNNKPLFCSYIKLTERCCYLCLQTEKEQESFFSACIFSFLAGNCNGDWFGNRDTRRKYLWWLKMIQRKTQNWCSAEIQITTLRMTVNRFCSFLLSFMVKKGWSWTAIYSDMFCREREKELRKLVNTIFPET